MAVRCETRPDLVGYGIAILVLGGVLFFCMLGAAAAIRENEWSDLEQFALLAFLAFDYLLLIAWVALRMREWRLLGDAVLHLTPAQPWAGAPFSCRMQFARPPVESPEATAELLCQATTSSGTGSKKNSKTKTLWRDKQIVPASSMLQFTFRPPDGLPAAGNSGSTEVCWWLRVRSGALGGFRRRFRMPLGKQPSVQPGEQLRFDAKFAASAANLESEPGPALKTIYTLATLVFFANVAALAWAYADRLPIAQPDGQAFEGKLRLGDLRQTSSADFAAQLEGSYAWKPGSLELRADTLRVRAWDCQGPCPRIEEIRVSLWHWAEDDGGGASGTTLARSEPMAIGRVSEESSVLDLGAQAFQLKFRRDADPRQLSLVLEVRTEKSEHRFGRRFGGASDLFGLVQAPGEAKMCASAKTAVTALEHFCQGRFAEMLSQIPAAERNRLLFLAIRRGNADAVRALLAAEVSVAALNSRGHSPLMVAAFADQPEIARMLLDAGADPNFVARDSAEDTGDRALGFALTAGAMRAAQVLLEKGADAKALHAGSPMVHVAVGADLPEALPLLAESGADFNARALWGDQPTPLMIAAGMGKAALMSRLIELGADPAAADRQGHTARDYAATHKKREALQRLKGFPGRCPLTGCG